MIPARDAASVIGRAITSVQRQSAPVAEIVVAVGPEAGSPPEQTRTWRVIEGAAADDPRIRVVANPEGATPAGLNRAIRESTGAVVVRVDAQSVLPEDYIERAVALLQATDAGNVGGRQVPVGRTTVQSGIAAAMSSRVGSGGAAYRKPGRGRPVDTVYLGVFRREALEEVGGYDERMTRNQDYELNLRLRQAGWTVWYDPSLAVEYTPRSSFSGLARQYFDYGRWRRLSARLHPGTLRLRQALPPAMVVLGSVGVAAAALRLIPWESVVVVTIAYVLGVAVDTRKHAPGTASWVVSVAAVATMHIAWGLGFLVGPPRGAEDPP